MPTPVTQTEALRAQVTRAIQRTTDLIADLKALVNALASRVPETANATEAERWEEVARLAGLNESTLERLEAVVETLADVLAGLTSADDGAAWLQHQRARLEAGEDTTAA
jgi:hypothetical protein